MQDNLVITYFSTPHPPTHTPFYNHSYSIFTSMYLTQIVIISKIESNHCTVKGKKRTYFHINTEKTMYTSLPQHRMIKFNNKRDWFSLWFQRSQAYLIQSKGCDDILFLMNDFHWFFHLQTILWFSLCIRFLS